DRRRARVALLRLRLATARWIAAHLRVHRDRHRRARLAPGRRGRVGRRRGAPAVRQLLPPRHGRPHGRAAARGRAPRASARTVREGRMNAIRRLWGRPVVRWALAFAGVAFAAALPLLDLVVPGVLPGPTYTPGTLQILALALIFAALALS